MTPPSPDTEFRTVSAALLGTDGEQSENGSRAGRTGTGVKDVVPVQVKRPHAAHAHAVATFGQGEIFLKPQRTARVCIDLGDGGAEIIV